MLAARITATQVMPPEASFLFPWYTPTTAPWAEGPELEWTGISDDEGATQDDSDEGDEREADADEGEDESNVENKGEIDEDEGNGGCGTDVQGVDECVNLADDIQKAFRGDFDFEGRFAYSCEVYPPLACLHIRGIGPVGQPLHERDAKLIASVATKVKLDTWVVDATQVTFENPKWELYVQNTVLESVCKALGATEAILPRCKLQRLLLHGPGSYPSFHREKATERGSFAKFDITLPSRHTGGEVHVFHGSKSQVFDFSDSSMMSTSALAWFTGVTREVKPVTSGYRLILSYNIVQGNMNLPPPIISDAPPAMARLRRVLQNWSAGLYREDTDIHVLSYLLQSSAHSQGINSLEQEDARLVAHLRNVADELGFKICLAKLEYRISGPASGPPKRDCGYCDRDEYDDCGDGFLIPEMDDDDRKSTMKLSNLVNLDGIAVLPPSKTVDLDPLSLVPADAFEDEEPDWTSFDGYRWDDGSNVHHHYGRVVLVLYHKRDELYVNPLSQVSGLKRKREVEI